MSVLFLINSCLTGGSELKTIRTANELKTRNINVAVAYLNNPGPPENSPFVDVVKLPLLRRGKIDFQAVKSIVNYIKINNIRIMICVNLYPSLYGFMVKRFFPGCRLEIYSMINKTDINKFSDKLQMVLYAPVLRSFSGLVFGCKAQQDKWVSRYRLAPDQCTHIYNGVDCSTFTPVLFSRARLRLREQFGFRPEEMVLVCVAGLRPVKRHLDLIEACRILHLQGQKVRLLLAGDGPEKDRLLTATAKAGLAEHVLFLGQLRDVRPVLAAADVFVLGSANETFSNAALEAMAMGKPVVLSNTGGAAEMVENGLNGYLFEPGNVNELVCMLTSLTCPLLRTRIGNCARLVVEKKFNFESMIHSYLQLIQTGISEQPVREHAAISVPMDLS